MKILLLHQYFLGKDEPGGSRFNQFVKYWEELDHEITVVAGTVHYTTGKKLDKYKGKWVVKEKESEKVTLYRTYVSEAYNKSFIGRLWAYFSFTISSLTACLFQIKKHDVIIVTSPPLFVGITGIVTSLFKKTPMVFEVRDLWPESAIDTGVLTNKFLIKAAYLIERMSYKFAKKINVLTPAFREKLIQTKGINDDKIIFIPNGADLDIFHPDEKDNWVRSQYGLKGKFVITYMGAHGVANNLNTLLDVAKECQDYKDIVFLLIGDGMEKEQLKERAKVEEINNVIFIDSQSKKDIPAFCNASDICTAVLKKVETFKTVYPNKVFDYMSCAKPILLGIDGVARELVENANCGEYIDPENPKEFKAALLRLYRDRDKLDDLGANGFHFVKKHFSRHALAVKYEEELQKIVANKM